MYLQHGYTKYSMSIPQSSDCHGSVTSDKSSWRHAETSRERGRTPELKRALGALPDAARPLRDGGCGFLDDESMNQQKLKVLFLEMGSPTKTSYSSFSLLK